MVKFIFSVIGILVELFFIIWGIIRIYKEYKASNTITEKTLFWMIILIFAYPFLMYTLDKTNLASKMGWVNKDDTERWFNYLVTYGSSFVSAIIGAISLVLMTIFQLKRQDEKDKETTRINNMPLLTYEVSRNLKDTNLKNILLTNCKKGQIINFNLKIRNVGMNAVKKSFIILSSSDLPGEVHKQLDNNGCINKNESVSIDSCLKLSKGDHAISLAVFYCDLINNWYSQNIRISIIVTGHLNKTEDTYISLKVEDEKLIKEEPKELKKLL